MEPRASTYPGATNSDTKMPRGIRVAARASRKVQGVPSGFGMCGRERTYTRAQIAKDEQEHVLLLRSVLGNQAIAKPEINLNAFGQVSQLNQFLLEARAFEDAGVSAYGGAAPLIQSKAILAAAARIALTEGEHAGALRLLIALYRIPTFPPIARTLFRRHPGGIFQQ